MASTAEGNSNCTEAASNEPSTENTVKTQKNTENTVKTINDDEKLALKNAYFEKEKIQCEERNDEFEMEEMLPMKSNFNEPYVETSQ